MVQLSETIFNLVTRSGFLKEFEKRVKRCQRSGKRRSNESIFDELNDMYFDTFGEYRFKSFEAFLKVRSRRNADNQTQP